MLFLSLLVPLLVPVECAPVPMGAERQARVCNRQHRHTDEHHDSLKDHVQHFVISEWPFETFTQFSDTEGTADEDCSGRDGDSCFEASLLACGFNISLEGMMGEAGW